jgi:hypothetical protein
MAVTPHRDRAPEGTALVRVSTNLDEPTDCVSATDSGGPAEGGPPVGVSIKPGTKFDQELNRIDAIRLRRPHKRFIEYFLGVAEGCQAGNPL